MDGGHVYQYYLGQYFAIRPITVSYQGDSLTVCESWRYRVLTRKDLHGRHGRIVVIQKNRQHFLSGLGQAALLGGCSRIDRGLLLVNDCATGRVEQDGAGGCQTGAAVPGRLDPAS